jgi:LuxR family maltose regulon positive regulatory protein
VSSLLRSYVSLRSGAPGAAVDAADRALAIATAHPEARVPDLLGLTGASGDVVAAAHMSRGIGLLYEGSLDAARSTLETAVDRGHLLPRVHALGSLALVNAWSGQLRVAEQLATRALALARELGVEQEPMTLDAFVALVRVMRRRDRLEEARHHLAEAEARATISRRRPASMLIANERALVEGAANLPAAGLAALASQRADELVRMPPRFVARRHAVEALLELALGDHEAAARTLDLAPAPILDIVSLRVRLAAETGDLRGARAWFARWPDEPMPEAERQRLLWDALLQNLEGDESAALVTLGKAIAKAEPEHDVGLFHSAGPLVLRPARALYRNAPSAFLRAVVERLVAPTKAPPAKELFEQITEREYAVLRLLPTRLANQEIADRLGISLNTVKTHLKHIYRKLGVEGRRDAVATAERMNLL